MWQFIQSKIGNRLHIALHHNATPASYQQALLWLKGDQRFRGLLIDTLRSLPFKAYKWETPAFSNQLIERPFECVISEAPWLERPADASAFADHLRYAKEEMVSFPNLGGDAHLLVPTDRSGTTNYCHLGSFTQSAPHAQQQALWHAVGRLGLTLVSDRPIWLSTAGDGVPWLHLRFDQTPKYYVHTDFVNPDRG